MQRLRFKADDGSPFPDWEKKKLGDVCTPLKYGMNAAAVKYDGENKYIRITDIDDESHLYKNDELVSPDGELDDKYLVGENDILLARTGASVGKSYLYDKKDGKLYYAGFLIKAHVKSENSKFIFYQTLTDRYARWVQVTSMRSGQPGINANEYSDFMVYVPSLPEQQKIAEFLSTIDTVVEKQKETVSAWEERKKGVMQKLFSQKVRFKADDGSDFLDWEEKKLGEVADVKVGEKPTLVSGNAAYEYVNAGTTNSGYVDSYNCDGDTVTTPSRGQGGIGYVAYQKCEFWLGPLCYKIKSNKDDVLTKFMYYALSFDSKKIVDLKKVGTIPAINRADLIELYMSFPCLAEQQKIADCLSALDEVIEKQKVTLTAWEELKKGLLQQMFV